MNIHQRTRFVECEEFLRPEVLPADGAPLAGRRVEVVDADAAGGRAHGDLKGERERDIYKGEEDPKLTLQKTPCDQSHIGYARNARAQE